MYSLVFVFIVCCVAEHFVKQNRRKNAFGALQKCIWCVAKMHLVRCKNAFGALQKCIWCVAKMHFCNATQRTHFVEQNRRNKQKGGTPFFLHSDAKTA